uniref:CNNM transmembrane domain-containing protein n=1 Tax=Corethron hystrix TaxID=216773 RepID=A0A7S1BZM8_9STRA
MNAAGFEIDAVDTELEENKNYVLYYVEMILCLLVAAFAAGVTMGMLSLDPLMLRIKLRSGTRSEKRSARKLLPLVADHHRLLVTLLLLTAFANEILPLVLDKLYSKFIAIMVSVTLVLFFGEIIPSAFFTGPNQLEIAAAMAPPVRFALLMLSPLAIPIAYVLDLVLSHGSRITSFNRKELNALMKIQYLEHGNVEKDEVNMIEGALKMSSKAVKDCYIELNNVFAIDSKKILDDQAMESIHISGHSRIPVYVKQAQNPNSIQEILGFMITKNLILVSGSDKRCVSSLPLQIPLCVDDNTPIIDLMDSFISYGAGRGAKKGHLALVCKRPDLATLALDEGKPVPTAAGVKGIITLEDIIEELLQKEIFDENDRDEKATYDLAYNTIRHWMNFVNKKRESRGLCPIGKRGLNRFESDYSETTSLIASNSNELVV